ncbi:hypothetical protein ACFV8T_14330 [Streptomyces sp. NPDC059832]|uniref:hypothetical protein n=1 Tax=unclassified Streptomyces TaxID=2593676 RepID=UPI00364E7B55
MSDGIAWIGAHSTTDESAAQPGMLGGTSLTRARGLDADAFLIALGADLDELDTRTPYKNLAVPGGRPGRPSPRVNPVPVTYGTYGDWVYVLEDWGTATWATGYRDSQVDAAPSGRGDRLRDDEPVEPTVGDQAGAG